MSPSNGGRGGLKIKNKDSAMMENLRGACPPHKRKDLDKLIKQMHGDEEKIMERIQEWWDEPSHTVQEESWESVNKKSVKKKSTGLGGGDRRDRGNRGGGERDSGGRAGGGGGSRGGRGNGRDRNGRDRRDRRRSAKNQSVAESGQTTTMSSKNDFQEPSGAGDAATPELGVPTPLTNAPALKGAWVARVAAASESSVTKSSSANTATKPIALDVATASSGRSLDGGQITPTPSAPAATSVVPESNPLVDNASSVQSPPGMTAVTSNCKPKSYPTPLLPSGNVWATKGSAHLIQAEKSPPSALPSSALASEPERELKPVPVPAPKPAPVVVSREPEPVIPPNPTIETQIEKQTQHQPEPSSISRTLETGIPNWGSSDAASTNVSDPGMSQASPDPSIIDIPVPPTSSQLADNVPLPVTQEPEPLTPMVEKAVPEPRSASSVVAAAPQQPPPPASPANQKVLNMGRWDTSAGDDTDTIDFGFGSFGAVIDTAANDIVQQVVNSSKEAGNSAPVNATAGTTISPARPPPGLSIGGMPPMPASAVMVHELENKLENASLNAKKSNSNGDQYNSSGQSQTTASTAPSSLPSGITQQNSCSSNYSQQQQHLQQQQLMPGMYNCTTGSGFVGMQPVLAGMPQQQPGKPHGTGISNHGRPQGGLQHQGLYGAQAPMVVQSSDANTNRGVDSTSGTSTVDSTSAGGAQTPATADVPSGMPSAIPYANPALHYGAQHAAAQHQFYAMGGHQQQGIGYNYGYAGHAQQFGGAIQGGFGYPQVMGQGQGYSASHYDDQGHQGNSHHSGSGGYQNKSGGGGGGGYRGRNTHNNNQYQSQYNQQQHGGYGGQPYGMGYHGHAPGGMNDPYAAVMQHQHQHIGIHSGFQDDDHQKGRKGSRGGATSTSSLQQQFHQGGAPHQSSGQPFGLQGQQQQQGGGLDSAPSSGGWSNQGAGGWSGTAAQSGGWQG